VRSVGAMLFGVRGLASSRGGERRECRRLQCSDVTSGRHHFGGCGFLLEKVDPLRLDLRRVDCWQVALTARTDEPLHLLE
jgi:hypothetical protein